MTELDKWLAQRVSHHTSVSETAWVASGMAMLEKCKAAVAALAARLDTAMDSGSSAQVTDAETKLAAATADMDHLRRRIDAAESKIPALKAAEAAATDAMTTAIAAFNRDATAHLASFRADYELHATWFASKLQYEKELKEGFARISQELQRLPPLVREAIPCALVAFHPFAPHSGATHLSECVTRLPAPRDIDASDARRPGFWPPIPRSTWPAPPPPPPPPGPSTMPARTQIYEVRNPPGPYQDDDSPAA